MVSEAIHALYPLINISFIIPTPILFYYSNLIEIEPNKDPTDFSMVVAPPLANAKGGLQPRMVYMDFY